MVIMRQQGRVQPYLPLPCPPPGPTLALALISLYPQQIFPRPRRCCLTPPPQVQEMLLTVEARHRQMEAEMEACLLACAPLCLVYSLLGMPAYVCPRT